MDVLEQFGILWGGWIGELYRERGTMAATE